MCSSDEKINDDGSYLIDEMRDEPEIAESCPSLEKCCSLENYSPPKCNDFKTPEKCGFRNKKGLGNIVSSSEKAEFAEFPWIVAVLKEYPENSKKFMYHNIGSLIHPKVVLTAAHNVIDIKRENIKIRGGEWNLEKNSEFCLHKERQVEKGYHS